MNKGKYVFSQLIDFLPRNDFISCTAQFKGNHKVQTFTC